MNVKRLAFLLLPFSLSSNTYAQNDFAEYRQNIPGSSLSFKMMPVKIGSFMIGSPSAEKKPCG
jgi:hypothetical protein